MEREKVFAAFAGSSCAPRTFDVTTSLSGKDPSDVGCGVGVADVTRTASRIVHATCRYIVEPHALTLALARSLLPQCCGSPFLLISC